jgi:hypothetical protein
MQVRFEGQGKDRLIAKLKRPKPTFGCPHGLKYQFGETLTFLQRVDAWTQIGALHFRFRPWGSTKKPLSPSDVGRPFVGSPGGHADPRFAVGLVPQILGPESIPPLYEPPKKMPKSWTPGNDGEKPSLYKCHPVAKLSLAMTCQWSGLVLLNPWTSYCNYPPGKTFGHLLGGWPGRSWLICSSASTLRAAKWWNRTAPWPCDLSGGLVVQGSGYGKPMT